jgi:hypothetical protein
MKIEDIKNLIQSCSVSFLIGSGTSQPYLKTLGNIENWLTELNKRKGDIDKKLYAIVKASIYKWYFEDVIYPEIKSGKHEDENYITTLSAYKALLLSVNDLILHRKNTLLNKQINLFTTNIDLFFERAFEDTMLEYNDGFEGRLKPVFDMSNFQKSYSKTSMHYENSSEIPVFNLIKLHGGISWKSLPNDRIGLRKTIKPTLKTIQGAIDEIIEDDLFDSSPFIEQPSAKNIPLDKLIGLAENIDIEDDLVFDTFFEEYEKIVMVNPTKAKFRETVLEEQYYEMMRIYANSLERVNNLLFVMGFSFADEHIRKMTIRAANSNPTLQIIIFAFNNDARDDINEKLGSWKNENILILTPKEFIKSSGLEDKERIELANRIKQFDCSTIGNEIFGDIAKTINRYKK